MAVGVGDLGKRLVEDGDVVGGGVGTGVSRPQQAGQGFAGVVQEAQQRVVAEAALVGRRGLLLLGVAGDQGGVEVFSLKSTILDGRVLRSRSVPGLEQEIFALLTVYQALVRMAGDVTTATPGLSVQRASFTVLFQAAADQIIVAPVPARGSTTSLIGAIGRAVLANLLPEQSRQQLKARYRKTSSTYQFQRDQHPRNVQA